MWELAKIVNSNDLDFDFEYAAYEDIPGEDRFLDLRFWTNSSYKVAMEFKLPVNRGNGNSNQMKNREKIYRDIARLKYLVDKEGNDICIGFFVCVTDENAYINDRGSKSKNYVYHGFNYTNNCDIPQIESLPYPKNFNFTWEKIKSSTDKRSGKWIKDGKYAWLNPIVIV
ncbi:MAG: hypothetical protein FWG87_05230 [Defluviitaleaceae bacterium]|nr:hypothetical protein [Defluviitaleaceae bacterium]